MGEFQIAKAFSDVLRMKFGLGNKPLEIPGTIPPRPCHVPTNFKAVPSASGVTVTWDAVYGAFGYHIKTRSNRGSWSFRSIGSNRWDDTWAADGQVFEYSIASNCGASIPVAWTSIISAVAHPWTAPGPRNIIARGTPSGFDIHWDPPDGDWEIERYAVLALDQDTPGAFINQWGVKGTSASITGLVSGHR
jgi:hypothetical protein